MAEPVDGTHDDAMTTTPAPIEPDTKDWTWVLGRPCPECAYDATRIPRADLGRAVRENAAGWLHDLARPGAAVRPVPTLWSTVEYACHVRDVHRVFADRLRLMLRTDDPAFDNWDQDETAVRAGYHRQEAAVVGPELAAAAERVAAVYDAVPAGSWERTGRRADGSVFTVESLGRYHLHDVVHHAWDVRGNARRHLAE